MALYALIAGGFGVSVVFFGGVRNLAETIHEGAVDGFLSQPKPALFHALSAQTRASGWGDLAACVFFFVVSGYAGGFGALRATVAVLAAAAGITAAGVLFHALAFWLGPVQALSRQLWEFLITFSFYPETLFGGALRFALYVLIPAGVVAWLPVDFFRGFSWERLAALLGATAAIVLLAALVWRAGLRRYASGSRIGAGPS
jgi:ABC-2 type transport system permease protein